MNVNWFK